MPITLDDITSVDDGARFFSADIHVHSYGASSDVKDPSMTVEAIIDTAIKEDISILAIADHNTDANVSRALSYAERYTAQLLLLPATEITTANGHLLVYFAREQVRALARLLAQLEII